MHACMQRRRVLWVDLFLRSQLESGLTTEMGTDNAVTEVAEGNDPMASPDEHAWTIADMRKEAVLMGSKGTVYQKKTPLPWSGHLGQAEH